MPIQSCITFTVEFQLEDTNKQFSDGVEVKYSETRGRYAVATRNIPTGECLAVERALFSNTLPRNSLKNCYLCHKDTICPTPCDECSGISVGRFDRQVQCLISSWQFPSRLEPSPDVGPAFPDRRGKPPSRTKT